MTSAIPGGSSYHGAAGGAAHGKVDGTEFIIGSGGGGANGGAGGSFIKMDVGRVIAALTLKAPITTAADDIHNYFFIVFQRKLDLMFQVNPLLGRGLT